MNTLSTKLYQHKKYKQSVFCFPLAMAISNYASAIYLILFATAFHLLICFSYFYCPSCNYQWHTVQSRNFYFISIFYYLAYYNRENHILKKRRFIFPTLYVVFCAKYCRFLVAIFHLHRTNVAYRLRCS